MAYAKDGYPVELANKVGHIKLIQDPMIQRMIEAFEDCGPAAQGLFPTPTGRIDLDGDCPIEQVITVDGGEQVVPNIARPERQIGFVQVVAQMIKMETINYLFTHRMTDPREVRKMLGQFTFHVPAALPLVGMNIPGMDIQSSVREAIHRFLSNYELYETLSYIVYREWQNDLEEAPFMACLGCGFKLELPRGALRFECPQCGEQHRLADYLGLCDQDAEDRSRTETVSNFRAVLEALVLFSFIIKFRHNTRIMQRTLFILDGPLMLRAQLSRLVDDIRALVSDQQRNGIPLHLVGVEKGGEIRAFADGYSRNLQQAGDFFAMDTKFVVEEIHGRAFNETTYRNRVNYGAKVVTRLGPDHVLVLNSPTGEYILSPGPEDLIGFEAVARALSKLVSYRHPNALIPVILANTEASISNRPSCGLLGQFVNQILDS